MKARTIVFSFIIAGVIGLVFGHCIGKARGPHRHRVTSSSPRVEAPPFSPEVSSSPSSTHPVSKACHSFQRKLLEANLLPASDKNFAGAMELPLLHPELLLAILPRVIPASDPCDQAKSGGVYAHLMTVCPTLLGKTSKDLKDGNVEVTLLACFRAVQKYRAQLVDEHTRDLPLARITDETTLIAKLSAAEIPRDGKLDLSRIAEIAERLEQVHSGRGYHDFALRTRYAEVLLASDPDQRAELREELAERLEEEKSSGEGSPGAVELQALLARDAGDLGAMRAAAEELRDSSPTKADYYLAWADYLGHHVDEARARLSSLAKSSPLAGLALSNLDAEDSAVQERPFPDPGLGLGLASLMGGADRAPAPPEVAR